MSKNITEAMHWFRKSAAQGDAEAYFRMGYMYEKGLTVPMNAETAKAWYERAAAKGSERAAQRLRAWGGTP